MKLAYHSFGPPSNAMYLMALDERLKQLLGEHEYRLVPLRGARMGSKQYRSLHPTDVALLTKALVESARAGCHAMVVGNIQDPAVDEARQLVDAPIVGLLEAALCTAAPFGAKVSIVLTHNRIRPLVRDRIERYGLMSRIHSLPELGLNIADVSRNFDSLVEDPDGPASRFLEIASDELEAGADVVIPGAGLLAALVSRALKRGERRGFQVDSELQARILDPVSASVRFAICLAEMHRDGASVSRLGRYESPPSDEIEEYFRAVESLADGGLA